jgi:hypothetical protein
MFDDEHCLRESPLLRRLLEHYVEVLATDGDAWQDRLAELPGVSAKEMTSLHGELLAYDWIEQNTGVVPVRKPGVVAACYRATSTGRLALHLAAACGDSEDAPDSATQAA